MSEAAFGEFGGAVDVHAHYLPPAYRSAFEQGGARHHPGDPENGLPDWSVGLHLDLMDSIGVATAILSITSPGLLLFDDLKDTVSLVKRVNDEGAGFVRAQPDRFGLFASLPLPDVEASLQEATRALDELQADGISLLTNYGGVYLGDDRFDPLFDELNRRGAVCAIHPTSPACWEEVSFGRSRGTVEFMFDTARAVANLAMSGKLDRWSSIRFIVPHGGGALTVMADRIHRSANRVGVAAKELDVIGDLRRQFYDLAGGPLPRQLPALLRLVDASQLLYGTDFPFSPASSTQSSAQAIVECELLSRNELAMALRGTSLQLFPRLQA